MPTKPKQFHPSGKTRQERRRDFDRTKRPPWHGWYSKEPWRSIRAAQLAREPFCRTCRTEDNREEWAVEVDHIIDHKGDWELFTDDRNLQSLCHMHHSRKTSRTTRFGQ